VMTIRHKLQDILRRDVATICGKADFTVWHVTCLQSLRVYSVPRHISYVFRRANCEGQMLRRELLKQAAGMLLGKHLGPMLADGYYRLAKRPFDEAPTGDLLQQLQQIARNLETIRLGVSVVYEYIFQEFMYDTTYPLPTVPKRNHPAWPYLHCLGHCFAVAVLTELSPAERREWSVWMDCKTN